VDRYLSTISKIRWSYTCGVALVTAQTVINLTPVQNLIRARYHIYEAFFLPICWMTLVAYRMVGTERVLSAPRFIFFGTISGYLASVFSFLSLHFIAGHLYERLITSHVRTPQFWGFGLIPLILLGWFVGLLAGLLTIFLLTRKTEHFVVISMTLSIAAAALLCFQVHNWLAVWRISQRPIN
jgi:hypothetical protein